MSELTTMESIRTSFIFRGIALFSNGLVTEMKQPADDEASHFEVAVAEIFPALQ